MTIFKDHKGKPKGLHADITKPTYHRGYMAPPSE
jgi:hypothetical protein